MNKCPVKITIQRQVNESGYLLQGDVCHLVEDIQAWHITHDEKEKRYNMNLLQIPNWNSQPYTKKKLLILETDNLLAEIEQVQVDHLRASKIYHQKMPYHAILLSPGAKCKWITKRINTHSQKAI